MSWSGRSLLLTPMAVLLGGCAQMSIEWDGGSGPSGPITSTAVAHAHSKGPSSTYPLTVPSGVDPVLVVLVSLTGHCSGGQSAPTVSGVSYAGAPLTQIAQVTGVPCDSNGTVSEQWLLVGPSPGTNSVVVALSGSNEMISGAMAFSGVNQQTPVRTCATGSGAASSSSVTVTTSAGDLVIDTVGQGTSINGPGKGETQLFLDNVNSATTLDNAAASCAPATGTSLDMTWDFPQNDTWQSIACSLETAP